MNFILFAFMLTDDALNKTVEFCPQSVRQHVLDGHCRGGRDYFNLLDNPSNFKFMLVDEKLKAIYCGVPKAGSTSWKTFLAKVAGGNPMEHQAESEQFLSNLGLKYLNIFPRSAIQLKLESYYKFFFVRHPLERLVSAYHDKIGRYNSYGDDIRKDIVEKVLNKDSTQSVSTKEAKLTRITFDTFVKYLIMKSGEEGDLDHHWEDIDKLCHPCQIHYNYIGKLETMDSDAENIITKLQSTVSRRAYTLENLNRKFSYADHSSGGYKARLRDFHNVSSGDMEQILEIYKDDMTKFGYSWNTKKLQTSCMSVVGLSNRTCC